MKVKSLLVLGSMAVLGMAMSSCSKEENLFDSDAAKAQRLDQYKANFVKKYGEVNPNQTWDFATMQPIYSRVSSRSASTRAAVTRGSVNKAANNMIIEKSVIDWMFNNMTAGNNNSTKGQAFDFETPGNEFTIVPIFQGNASYYWELCMKIDEQEITIWKKGQDLSYRMSESGSWQYPGTTQNGVNKGAYQVQAPAYTVSGYGAGSVMSFYLKVWNNESAANNPQNSPRIYSSYGKKMLALTGAPIPAAVPQDNEVIIIGCEDNTDNDFEDLVFMVYGKPVPVINKHDDLDVIEAKRYMVEDLGGDDDFDFNDIVIDVQNIYTKRELYSGFEGQELSHVGTEIRNHQQRAILRAAGGTLNFTITIGSTSWTKEPKYNAGTMLNTGADGAPIDYTAELAVIDLVDGDWNPQQNNITITIHNSKSPINVLSFPGRGEVPMIITTDPTGSGMTHWMKERISIPTDWTYWNYEKE